MRNEKNSKLIRVATIQKQYDVSNTCSSCKRYERIQSLRQYTFKQRLAHKCKLYGQSLLVMNEAYSTITCFKCDHQSRANVNDRWFHSQQCGHQDHRDINPGTSK
eukprot:NODE_12_length_45166_cov_0.552511.p24 type:complete len:105 gc:universal NODE_12_length_45166_cov_0.552511:21576-21262(-)